MLLHFGQGSAGLAPLCSLWCGLDSLMCCGQPVSSHGVSDMPSYWYSGLVLLCMALQNCLGFLHCIKLNPLKYFTPFPGPFSVLPGEMSRMFAEKTLPLKLFCSASWYGVWPALHVLQHGGEAMAALSCHMPSPMLCPQSSVALMQGGNTAPLSLSYCFAGPPKQDYYVLI